MPRSHDDDINPPHNVVRQETPDAMRARLLEEHHRAGTMDTYYYLYDDERKPSRDPHEGGRGR